MKTIRGITYAKEQASDVPKHGYLPILRAINIDRELDFEDFVYVPSNLVSPEQLLKRGDVVIAASSGSKSVVGKAAQLSLEWHGSFGAFCMGIRPSTEIEPRFVGHFLQSDEYRHRVSKLAAGSNINNLKREHIESFPFRLAPLEEQRRLSDKIDEVLSDLDAGVAALERARANLKRYRAAVLKAAVEGKLTEQWRKAHPGVEPASKFLGRILAERRRKWEEAQLAKFVTAGKTPTKGWEERYPEPEKPNTGRLPSLPKGWCWATVDQVVFDAEIGLDRGRPQQSPEAIGAAYVKMNQVTTDGRIVLDDMVYVVVTDAEQRRYELRVGDILFNTRNSAELVGKNGLVRNIQTGAVYNNNLMRIRAVIEPEWLNYQMCSSPFKKQVNDVKRATTNIAAVYAKDLMPLVVAVPPLSEQKRSVEEIGMAWSICFKIEEQIEAEVYRASRLRQSILKRAFEGKLVPQDPLDEPASVLLERIRNARTAESPQRAHKRRKSPA